VLGAAAVSVAVHAAHLRREMARRGWECIDLAREAGLSQATIREALAGRRIAAKSLGLIALALSRWPPLAGVDDLLFDDDVGLD